MAYNSSSKQIKVIKPKKSAGRLMYSEAQRLQDPQAKSGKILDSRVINALEDDLAVLIKDSNYQYKKILLDEIYTLLTNINVLTADNSSSFAQELADLASENILNSLKSLSDKSPSASTIYETLKDGLKSNSSILSELKSLLKETYDKLNSVSSKIVEAFNSSSVSKASSTNLNKQTLSSFAKFIHKTTLANTTAIKELINTKFEDNSKWLNAKFLRTYTRIARVEDTLGSTNEKIDKSLKELSEIALDIRKIKNAASKSSNSYKNQAGFNTGSAIAVLLPVANPLVKTLIKSVQSDAEKNKNKSASIKAFKEKSIIKAAATGTLKKVTKLEKSVKSVEKSQKELSEEYKKDKEPKSKMLAFIKFITSPSGAVVLGFLWGFFKGLILKAIGNVKEKIDKFVDFLNLDGQTKEALIQDFLQKRFGLDVAALKKDFLYIKDTVSKIRTADIEKLVNDTNEAVKKLSDGFDKVVKFLTDYSGLVDFIQNAVTVALENWIALRLGKYAIDQMLYPEDFVGVPGKNKGRARGRMGRKVPKGVPRGKVGRFARAGRALSGLALRTTAPIRGAVGAAGGKAIRFLGSKVALRTGAGIAKFAAKGALRLIPGVGWALLASDVADLAGWGIDKLAEGKYGQLGSLEEELQANDVANWITSKTSSSMNKLFDVKIMSNLKTIEERNKARVKFNDGRSLSLGDLDHFVSIMIKHALYENAATKEDFIKAIQAEARWGYKSVLGKTIQFGKIREDAELIYNTIDKYYKKGPGGKSFIENIIPIVTELKAKFGDSLYKDAIIHGISEYNKKFDTNKLYSEALQPGWLAGLGNDIEKFVETPSLSSGKDITQTLLRNAEVRAEMARQKQQQAELEEKRRLEREARRHQKKVQEAISASTEKAAGRANTILESSIAVQAQSEDNQRLLTDALIQLNSDVIPTLTSLSKNIGNTLSATTNNTNTNVNNNSSNAITVINTEPSKPITLFPPMVSVF